MQCIFPFEYKGQAYNDCSQAEGDESIGVQVVGGPNGWCPTHGEVDPTLNMIKVDGSTEWGQCKESGFVPSECIVTPWTVHSECTELCGGGTQQRQRRIVSSNDGQCPELQETKPCNMHSCAQANTMVGGPTANRTGGLEPEDLTYLGFGYTLDEVPDYQFKPHSVSAVLRSGMEDAISEVAYFAGETDFLRRVDVAIGKDVNGTTGCKTYEDITDEDAADDMSPVHACRFVETHPEEFITAQTGSVDSTVAERHVMALAAPAVGKVYAVYKNNMFGLLDMALSIPCEEWMAKGLSGLVEDNKQVSPKWEVEVGNKGGSTDLHKSNELEVVLSASGTPPNTWVFRGFRKEEYATFLGPVHGIMADKTPAVIEKNVMCMAETGRKGTFTAGENCCEVKQASTLYPPKECMKPASTSCTQQYTQAVQDFKSAQAVLTTYMRGY